MLSVWIWLNYFLLNATICLASDLSAPAPWYSLSKNAAARLLTFLGVIIFIFIRLSSGIPTPRELYFRDRMDQFGKDGDLPEIKKSPTNADFEPIRKIDPQFTVQSFESFIRSFFATIHQKRASRALNELSAYLSKKSTLTYLNLSPAQGFILKNIEMDRFEVHENTVQNDQLRLSISVMGMYVEGAISGSGEVYQTEEKWFLSKGLPLKPMSHWLLDDVNVVRHHINTIHS